MVTGGILAKVGCEEDLHAWLRARFDALNISRDDIDRLAGLPERYACRVLCDPPMKGLSLDSSFKLVAAAGAAIVLIEDAQALAEIKRRGLKRHKEKDSASGSWPRRSARKLAKRRNAVVDPSMRSAIARKGGLARAARDPRHLKKKRMLRARNAAIIRWERVKEVVK